MQLSQALKRAAAPVALATGVLFSGASNDASALPTAPDAAVTASTSFTISGDVTIKHDPTVPVSEFSSSGYGLEGLLAPSNERSLISDQNSFGFGVSQLVGPGTIGPNDIGHTFGEISGSDYNINVNLQAATHGDDSGFSDRREADSRYVASAGDGSGLPVTQIDLEVAAGGTVTVDYSTIYNTVTNIFPNYRAGFGGTNVSVMVMLGNDGGFAANQGMSFGQGSFSNSVSWTNLSDQPVSSVLLIDFSVSAGTVPGAWGDTSYGNVLPTIGAVPEPGTTALMLAGVAGVVAAARRRKENAPAEQALAA